MGRSADASEGAANAAARARAKAAEPWNRTSANLATGNVYQPASNRTTGAGRRDKTWDEMSDSERRSALDKVDWEGLGKMTGTTPSASGGGGGSGSDKEKKTTLNTDALKKYYDDALKALLATVGQSGKSIDESVARMQASPYNTANAYANLVAQAPTVAANPIAEYAAAAGISPTMAAEQVALSQAQGDAYTRAMQNAIDVMSTSQQQANASRLADIGLIETGARQDLANNQLMLQLALEKARIGDITGLQQQNLQNELNMRNAITSQIGSIFQGQNVAPESILKLIESALAKLNTNKWSGV